MKLVFAFLAIFAFCFMSCELLLDLLDNNDDGGFTPTEFIPTTAQMVSALTEALISGATDAGSTLSKEDAFYKVEERMIPLPPEADPIVKFINNSSIMQNQILQPLQQQLQQQLVNTVLRINRAAEESAKDVAGIFGNAIREMTFVDALGILKAEPETAAATQYLQISTTDPLKDAFGPKLDAALGSSIVGSISAKSAWDNLTSTYNNFANHPPLHPISIALALLSINIEPVNTDLSEFVLDRALTAVFTEMAVVEKRIRADPFKFLSDFAATFSGIFSDLAAKVFDWAKN